MLGIRARHIGFTSFLVLLVGGSISVHFIRRGRERTYSEYANRCRTITKVVAGSVVNELYFLDAAALKARLAILLIDPGIRFARALDPDGRLVADGVTRPGAKEVWIGDPFTRRLVEGSSTTARFTGRLLEVGQPVFMPDGGRAGSIEIGFNVEEIRRAARENTRASLVITALCLGVGVLISLYFSARLAGAVRAVAAAARAMGEGDLKARVHLRRRDELGGLARSLNRMAADLDAKTVSRDYVESILQSMADVLIVVSPQGVIRDVNRAALVLLGYRDRHDLVGRRLGRVLSADGPDPTRVADEGLANAESALIARDGRRIPVSISIAVLRDRRGRRQGHVCVATDVTDRKRYEQSLECARDSALENARLKSEFLANMSHEIRTPMNGVIGMTDLLLDTELSPEQREFAETVKKSGEVLLAILNDILDFSKIEAGRLEVEAIDFELRDTVEQVRLLLDERARVKGLALDVRIAPAVPGRVRGDPVRLRQVLTNLVTNAIKFTAAGRVTVRVDLVERTPAHDVVRFAVADTGIGISAEGRQRLFQAFSQADGSTARCYGGTGLGLAISRQLCRLMGGEIGVESEEGQGSTFTFVIPFRHAAPAGGAGSRGEPEAGEREAGPDAAPARGRVLVVEDNPVNQRLAVHMLEKIGYTVDVAGNGREAVAILDRDGPTYQVVFMDCQMPVMNGFEATRAVRERERREGRPPVPIVALTANAMKGDREECLAAGMNAYLAKPLRRQELLDVVARLERTRPRDRA